MTLKVYEACTEADIRQARRRNEKRMSVSV